jgi:hypothetical protein
LDRGALPSISSGIRRLRIALTKKSFPQISLARDAAREQSLQTSIPGQAPRHCYHSFNMNQHLIVDQRTQ